MYNDILRLQVDEFLEAYEEPPSREMADFIVHENESDDDYDGIKPRKRKRGMLLFVPRNACRLCDHRSELVWHVEEMLTFGNRLYSTHCSEFLLCRPAAFSVRASEGGKPKW